MKQFILLIPVMVALGCASAGRAVQEVAEPYKVGVEGLANGQFSTNLSYLAVDGQSAFTVTLYESGKAMWSNSYNFPAGSRVYRINLGGEAGWGLTEVAEQDWEVARASLRGLPWDTESVE